MSVKPNRKPDEGAAMVGCTLLGCISDKGGLTGLEVAGVLGVGGGDETIASMLSVTPWVGASSCSARDERLGGAKIDLLNDYMGQTC